MSDSYSETKEILGAMALVKMKMNAHKGAIEDIETGHLIGMLRSEIQELEEAINTGDRAHIVEEAADAMNYIVAIVHQQITTYRKRKEVNPDLPHILRCSEDGCEEFATCKDGGWWYCASHYVTGGEGR